MPYRTKNQFKDQLSDLQFSVLREGKNEPPRSGVFLETTDEGNYLCAACENLVFSSKVKIPATQGYAAFTETVKNGAYTEPSEKPMQSEDVRCTKCSSYLGYIGQSSERTYHINSAALLLHMAKNNKKIRGDTSEIAQKKQAAQDYADKFVQLDQISSDNIVTNKKKRGLLTLFAIFWLAFVAFFTHWLLNNDSLF